MDLPEHVFSWLLFITDLPRVTSNNGPPGLSVVSAPAPVVQRPDLAHPGSVTPGSNISRIGSQQSVPEGHGSASHRSTRSQRIRGASNNLRLRQIEMRENHATVLSWQKSYWCIKHFFCQSFVWECLSPEISLLICCWQFYSQQLIVRNSLHNMMNYLCSFFFNKLLTFCLRIMLSYL